MEERRGHRPVADGCQPACPRPMWEVSPKASWTTTTVPLGVASGRASWAGMGPSAVSMVIWRWVTIDSA